MNSLLIWILLLCIWNSILFFGKNLGVSVILFNIPFLIFTVNILLKNNKIKNKYGLLFIIPITFLSLTYLLFNSFFFNLINIPIITILFIFMYIYTMKPTYNIGNIINDFFTIIFEPLNSINDMSKIISTKYNGKHKISDKTRNIIKSLLITLPIIVIVLMLLSSADMIFEQFFTNFFSIFEHIKLEEIFSDAISRIIIIVIMFFYLTLSTYFIINNYTRIKYTTSEIKVPKDNYTFKLLLTILNIIYVIFDIIQIKSLILHQVSMDISYAEYARQGFFQLMFVSVINLSIILISKLFEDKETKLNNNYVNIMSFIMIILTFIIIISSFLRMNMYESEYGYTLLRLLVYFALITESIALIPTCFYIFNSNINITKYYMIIVIMSYTLLNYINVDYIIAYRNINRYYETNKIDLEYLENYNTDNIELLINLYNKTEDSEIHNSLNNYFRDLKLEGHTKIEGFQEYNLSKSKANKLLDKIQINYIDNELNYINNGLIYER